MVRCRRLVLRSRRLWRMVGSVSPCSLFTWGFWADGEGFSVMDLLAQIVENSRAVGGLRWMD